MSLGIVCASPVLLFILCPLRNVHPVNCSSVVIIWWDSFISCVYGESIPFRSGLIGQCSNLHGALYSMWICSVTADYAFWMFICCVDLIFRLSLILFQGVSTLCAHNPLKKVCAPWNQWPTPWCILRGTQPSRRSSFGPYACCVSSSSTMAVQCSTAKTMRGTSIAPSERKWWGRRREKYKEATL